MSNRTAGARVELAAPDASCHARRGWFTRVNGRLGAYGITATLGAGAFAVLLPLCGPTATPAPPSTQQQVVDITNQLRAENGRAPLAINPTLTAVAQARAADQASVDTMSHTDGTDPGTRIVRSGYPTHAWGENSAGGYGAPDSVMAAWMSPGHRANILNGSFTQIGLGLGLADAPDGTVYWSMEMGRPW